MASDIVGMDRLVRDIRRVENFPTRVITQSAKAGANPMLKKAILNAPKGKTGSLKKGMKLKLERSRNNPKGKKVYRVIFKPEMNDIFQKPIINKGIYGGKKDTGYYPVSQEFGFKSRNGREQGKEYIQDAFRSEQDTSRKKIIKKLTKEVEKLLR